LVALSRLQSLVPRLSGHTVLVLGDVILDEYLIGQATRMSREAPIPVLEFESRRLIPGGAANPAANVSALGSTAMQVGVVGADAEAATLRAVLQALGIETAQLVVDPARPTTVKTRLLAQMGLRFPQQVARMDRISREPVGDAVLRSLHDVIAAQVGHVQAILMSDYGVGMLTPALVDMARSLAHERGLLLTADAQGGLDKYTGFGLVKCNADEAQAFLRRPLVSDAAFGEAAAELCATLHLTGAMLITRGAAGITLARADGVISHCPAPKVTDVYDTVGAGDTAVAVLTLAVLGGASYEEAAMLANFASGLVVRRVGNYTPSPAELRAALADDDAL
jgi:rfaE bifunctional protein kinase chain/domain